MVKPIRVLELIKGFNIESGGGGAERFAIELSQALDKSRFEISMCSLWDFSTQDERDRRSSAFGSRDLFLQPGPMG